MELEPQLFLDIDQGKFNRPNLLFGLLTSLEEAPIALETTSENMADLFDVDVFFESEYLYKLRGEDLLDALAEVLEENTGTLLEWEIENETNPEDFEDYLERRAKELAGILKKIKSERLRRVLLGFLEMGAFNFVDSSKPLPEEDEPDLEWVEDEIYKAGFGDAEIRFAWMASLPQPSMILAIVQMP